MARTTTARRTLRTGVGALALVLAPGAPVALPGAGAASAEPSRAVVASASGARLAATAAAQARRRFQLRVATWNISGILSDRAGRPHRPWSVRRGVVARQLLGQAPGRQHARPADVIALQEANTSRRLAHRRTQYSDLVHQLERRARGRDHYRTVRPRLHLNATRIAYNSHRLRLLRAGAVRWRSQEMRADGARMMAWATFRARSTGARFFFASVHLETASKRVRLRQWRQLVRVVPRLAHGLPIVVGGDFNTVRAKRSPLQRMLPRMRRAGFGDALGQTGPGTLRVSRVRAHHTANATYNSVNFFKRYAAHSRRRGVVGQSVDYLFVSNRLRVQSWAMVLDRSRGGSRLRGVIPSDHHLIRSTVVLR